MGQRPIYSEWNGDSNNKNTMANYRKRAINCLKMLKRLPFLNTYEQTLISDEYIRIRERLNFLCSSRDKEHDGVWGLLISVSMAKLWPL